MEGDLPPVLPPHVPSSPAVEEEEQQVQAKTQHSSLYSRYLRFSHKILEMVTSMSIFNKQKHHW